MTKSLSFRVHFPTGTQAQKTMAKTTETTGKTTFSSQRGAVFCFAVSSAKIWLEQQATKQQWQCTVSSVSDFALKGVGMPHAVVMDYLAKSLGRTDSNRDSDFEVDLVTMSEGRMRLEFIMKFSLADIVWKPEYQFVLQPIEVTETQMLLAKLHDANDSLNRLQSIVPAWVVESNDPISQGQTETLQIVAVKGTKSWMFLCSLAKRVLENSGDNVETAKQWTTTATKKTTSVVSQYWSTVQDLAKQATGSVRQLLLEQYASKA
ncbi:hypothetical protein P3T76_006023 [Phytophthora citrophthora]|uniref:Uncharacterized protein n=1 Tax=Phytophthora citrophthora TaxID=4793 RepID=A0AAD9GPF6_9STRA|nr:hypothetical protein P3T76_006023 [Phytophthora citrophthora]